MPEQGGISVSQLNLLIAEAIRKDPRIRSVSVRGEVSGFRHHIASGHWYFTLKDTESSVSCVMFRQNTLRAALRPEDGQSVIITGYVDVYPKNGSIQLYALTMHEAGTGDMFVRFEALKRKLFSEGLFDAGRKKQLPMMPQKVAVVTSESGAAIRDIWNVSARRNPSIPILLVPVTVQGEKAGAEIAAGIRTAGRQPGVDVIIVARGGGSAEDLWCFNDELIARAIAESDVPVVSGVGHEIDTTICDLAADVRAATPSNAAEIVFPDKKELDGRIRLLEKSLFHAAGSILRGSEKKIHDLQTRLTSMSPERRIADLTGRCSMKRAALHQAIRIRMEEKTSSLLILRNDLDHIIRRRTDNAGMIIRQLSERLEAVNPMNVMKRGYALVYSDNGILLTSKADAVRKDKMKVRFSDGEIEVYRNGRKTGINEL